MPDWVEIYKKAPELLDKILSGDEVVLFKEACSCESGEDFNDGLLVLTNQNIIFIRRDSFEPVYEVGLRAPIKNISYITYSGIFYQMIEMEVEVEGCLKKFNFMDFTTYVNGERKVSEICEELQKIIDTATQK